jgi:predicted RNA polymerase sigma factor
LLDRLKRNAPVDSANWDMSEQMIALKARKANMIVFTEDLYNGALEAHKALWPRQATPVDPSDLGNDL